MKFTFKCLFNFLLIFLVTQAAVAQSFCTQVAMNDQLGSVANNATMTFTLAALTGNDAQTLELESFTQPANGMLSYDAATKMFTYMPAAGSSGTVSFNYTLKREMETRLGAPLMINGEAHYYELMQVNPSLSWNAARSMAGAKSYNGQKGYLATITSAAENEVLRQKLTDANLGFRAWIAGRDSIAEGTFRWVTGPGAPMVFTYTNWLPGEPNNVGNEDYVTINANGFWNDLANEGNPAAGFAINLFFVEYGSAENCNAGLTATASIMVNATTPPTVPNTGGSMFCTQVAMNDQLGSVDNNKTMTFTLAALTGNDAQMLELESFTQPASGMLAYNAGTQTFTYTPAAGSSGTISFNYTLKREMETRLGTPFIMNGEEHYYEVLQVNPFLTWNTARSMAAAMSYNGKKGYLATITSAAENEVLRQKLVNSSLGSRAWIAGRDSIVEGSFRWITGPEARMPFTYTNWLPGEPNNVGNEDYVAINTNGFWNDLPNGGNPAAGFAVNLYFVEYGSAENCNAGLTATASIMVNGTTPPVTTCNLMLTTITKQAQPWWPMWGVMNGTGSIDLTVTGGTAPYTYRWNAGVTTQDLPTATPGRYSVTVTDANGCTAMTTLYVGVKDKPMVLTTSHMNPTMAGGSNGFINLSVINGTGPYTYRWSNGARTEDLTNVMAGTYTVEVMDAMGKKATTSIVVSEPGMPLSAYIAHQNVMQSGGFGSINLTPVGGVGPYTFKWNAGAITEDLPQVVPGRYIVTITDATGATVTASVYVNGFNSMMVMGGREPETGREISLNPVVASGGLEAYPNPAKTRATIAFSMAEEGAYQVDLYDIRGSLVQQVSRGNAQRDQQVSVELDATKHAKGIYLVKLVTGKTVLSKRIVIEP